MILRPVANAPSGASRDNDLIAAQGARRFRKMAPARFADFEITQAN